jgi:hypothetical protein
MDNSTELTYEQYQENMKDRIEKLITKLHNYKKFGNSNKEIMYCTEICSLIMDLGSGLTPSLKNVLNNQIPTQVNLLEDFLNKIDVEKMEIVFSLCIIRVTSQSKNSLKSWLILRDSLYEKLAKTEKNPKSIMCGLY